jgi:hypothetical protein
MNHNIVIVPVPHLARTPETEPSRHKTEMPTLIRLGSMFPTIQRTKVHHSPVGHEGISHSRALRRALPALTAALTEK